ncbi:MAG: hypothetical protein A2Z37_09225 [Chloroflexi bacterium RBG_19FT_COMBO_62_14]|nr:MAG: hypothetical protein A2Z37_09225 [Chloroflexi bacterium RBG_19FT_COMBO_62_14]
MPFQALEPAWIDERPWLAVGLLIAVSTSNRSPLIDVLPPWERKQKGRSHRGGSGLLRLFLPPAR